MTRKPKKTKRGWGGRPRNSARHLTLKALRPWESLGMSRATWFRHGKPSAMVR